MFSSCGTHLSVKNAIIRLVTLDGWYVPSNFFFYWSGFGNRTGSNFLGWNYLQNEFMR